MTSVNVYSKEQTDAKLLLKQAQLTVTPAGGSQTDIADTVDESPDNTYANRLVTSKGVYTALSGKADDNAVAHLTGASFTGPVAFADSVTIGAVGDTADLTQVGNVNLTGDLTISGNITQNGSSYETHAQHVYTTNDYIITRDGATGALSAGTYSGFQVKKYDGTNDGRLVVDSSGTARVGDVGDEQPLLTRAESASLTDGDLLKWDGTNLKAVGVAVDSAPTDSSTNPVTSGGVYSAIDTCVKLSGDQIIQNIKRFSSGFYALDTSLATNVTIPTDDNHSKNVIFQANNYSNTGIVSNITLKTSGSRIMRMNAIGIDGSNSILDVVNTGTGTTYATCPTPSASSTGGNNIATCEWVNSNSLSTNVVHRTGNETKTGDLTVTGHVTSNSDFVIRSNYSAPYKIYKTNFTMNPLVTGAANIAIYDGNDYEINRFCTKIESDGKIHVYLEIRNTDGTFKSIPLGVGD